MKRFLVAKSVVPAADRPASAARLRFVAMAEALGVPLAEWTPAMGLDLMARFYAEDPADGYLTCSWGKVTKYGPEELGFSVTRWAGMGTGNLGELLSVKVRCGPPAMMGDLPGWMMHLCDAPEHLTGFLAEVEANPAFQRWGHGPGRGAAIEGGDDDLSDTPFDCWGERDPDRPVLGMTESQWRSSDDVPLMLAWLRQEWRGDRADLDRLVQRYLLACCRRIWSLLVMDESRRGIEVAEAYLDGGATVEEFGEAEWDAEGAAFFLDPFESPFDREETPEENESRARYQADRRGRIDSMVEGVESLPPGEVDRLLVAGPGDRPASTRHLLRDAAYLVDKAMNYPGIRPKHGLLDKYRYLLPAPLFREFVGNPFDLDSSEKSRLP